MADEWPGDDVEAPPSVIVDIFGDVAPAVVVALPNAGKQRHGRPRTEEFRLTMTSLTNEMLEMVPSACPFMHRQRLQDSSATYRYQATQPLLGSNAPDRAMRHTCCWMSDGVVVLAAAAAAAAAAAVVVVLVVDVVVVVVVIVVNGRAVNGGEATECAV
ncbi:hypothetical protein GGP41_009005 [Bipolaris sorokiniana]|uniref:Uncharacterized protein n=1 Tax=Cochliobolus sativus TaxID=45130 RepID=A0A8H5ZEE2_COCSA|nr:hypothetical protein GGP41_009005 [Bipolaris sorokiniana]